MHIVVSRIARGLAVLSVVVAMTGSLVPTTMADGGSNIPGSPFNGHDGVIDTNAQLTANDKASGQTDNSFGQGAKEDATLVNVVTGSIPPNKNDLTSLYVSGAIGSNNHVFLYLAWQRAVNIGSANLDIELNQNSFSLPLTDAKDVALNRKAGDLLVLYDFQGQGTPVLSLFTWITSGVPCAVSQDSAPCWKSLGTANANASEAAVSGNGLTGEAVIDLTAQGLIPNDTCESFAQGWDKARSSTSLTAELKDFISPGPAHFNTCGAVAINKMDGKGGALAGAVFGLYSDAQATNLLQTFTATNTQGKACLEGLQQGTFYVREISAPSGYALDPDTEAATINQIGNCTSGATVVSFSDVPLSKITVSFESLAAGNPTSATIQCTGDGSAQALPEGTPRVLGNGTSTLLPGTYSCTVVVSQP
jgi:Prealbumin-like fold domain